MLFRLTPRRCAAHRLTEQHGRAQADLQTLEAKAAEPLARVRQATALTATAETLERLGREAAALLRRAADQRQQMAHLSSAAGKSLDDAINEVLDAEGKLDEAETAREKLVDRRNRAADEIALVRSLRVPRVASPTLTCAPAARSWSAT